ncbi:unnamed protein product, partial [Amoebophrya sp. A120]|eukprot:GSA120T00021503001.1
MMFVRSLLFGVFCLTGSSFASVPDPDPGAALNHCDEPVTAHVCSYLWDEFPLHAIFDAVLTGQPAGGQFGELGTEAKDRELYAKFERLKEHSWKRFYQLLRRHPVLQQAHPIRGASRLFRGPVVSSTLPKVGFATELLSYVEPEVLRTHPDITMWIPDGVTPQALGDSFRHFLH